VESALIAHPAVREAAVVGREDSAGLLKPAAYVVANSHVVPSAQLVSELQQWVAEHSGHHKRPRWIEFLEELPKTATGKLQRFKLRQQQNQLRK
jgi:acyl-coenzyme A synthetase/AMP-(fatty) acid ligase